jgi:nucleotide-binding universal stress UspA family protein
MTLATVMASLTLARPNTNVLEIAASAADKLGAGVIGLACCRPIQVVCRDFAVPASLFEEDRRQIARQSEAVELEFRAAMARLKGRKEWRARTTIVPLAEYIADEARGADLIVVGAATGEPSLDPTRQADVRDLVMRVGRPVLVVPDRVSSCSFDRVLVTWKDTREAQRAIVDALPFLRAAAKVTVVEIAPEPERTEIQERLAEIVSWLGSHGVKAEARVVAPNGANAVQLEAIADEMKADLIVAGAYGYSRQDGWVVGGVTSELLAGRRHCALLAH